MEAAPKFSKAGFPLFALPLRKIFEVSFRLWERKLGLFFGIAFLFNLPHLLIMFWLGIDFSDRKAVEAFVSGHLFSLVYLGLTKMALMVGMEAVIVKAAIEGYFGNPVGLWESLQAVFSRIPSLLWITLLLTVILPLGFVLVILPGLYFLLIAFVVIPVVVSESIGGMAAIRRSRDLMRGEIEKAFGFLIVWVLFSLLLQWILHFVPEGFANRMAAFLTGLLITSYICVFITVFYLQAYLGKEKAAGS